VFLRRMSLRLCIAWLLLSVAVGAANGSDVGLSWKNYCVGQDGHTSNLTWICNSNANTSLCMTCSFTLDADMPDFTGVSITMVGNSEAATLPDWWELGDDEASCRRGLLTLSADGSGIADGSVCMDPWPAGGYGTGALGPYTADGDRALVSATWTLGNPVALEATQEYFALQFRISAARTVGDCAGCAVPMAWGINRLLAISATSELELQPCVNAGAACITWQSSSLPCSCPGPARNATWGLVKSLYR